MFSELFEDIHREKIDYTLEFHDSLCPLIWNEKRQLREVVRARLLRIAKEFLDTHEIISDVEDVIMTGSVANYNWSQYSDIDLHIIVADPEDLEVKTELWSCAKTLWNATHDVTVYGFDVELYIEAASNEHQSTGTYSLLNQEWIRRPRQFDTSVVDIESTKKKADTMIKLIDNTIRSDAGHDAAQFVLDRVYSMRKTDLYANGELASGNLAFKIARNNGYIDDLRDYLGDKVDRALSLE